ncbi:hypothetical protein EIN_398320 [Entamoeba invadens IP1]|uniref:Uncharacterized protein n=1 Tax=Entamoeba invadens IP1 TaxID=370355 RepID=A0A0A1UA49_ENTIV|nr:hypothetical protein EIN_398320 [Entamoeba invadens IP1]ELP91902.1 hypothetical protein EIN_398320 [Entamoeba invadens IP1]|eukprot:XP_004258673.1 hypothetical protein EIN_398320 [Entamoeba invadens IP1]
MYSYLHINSKPPTNMRCPILSLSTQTVFRHRNFTTTIVMSTSWREFHRLTAQTIIKACFSMTCVRETDKQVIPSCSVCNPERALVEIDHFDELQIGPSTINDGMEKYTFNCCKSFCSSSRNHQHSRICLCLDLPGGPFYSTPFVLQARDKKDSQKEVITVALVSDDIKEVLEQLKLSVVEFGECVLKIGSIYGFLLFSCDKERVFEAKNLLNGILTGTFGQKNVKKYYVSSSCLEATP